MRRNLPKGVHRVRRRLADGNSHWHFYVWRGGPRFWTGKERHPTDPEFFIAFANMAERPRPSEYMTPKMVDDFPSSAEMPKAERTRKDYRTWALRFAAEFADAPADMFEERESRGVVNDWRAKWRHSPKQYDYAGTVATRILNWAVEQGKLREHHCERFKKVYRADRADIVWTPADREAIEARAPMWVRRILVAACETGLRPGDLIRLSWSHIEATPKGRRIKVRTNKRKRTATIPVTPTMGELLDATPKARMLILVSANGRPLTEHRASEGLRQWRDQAGLSVDLRLQDARGAAATRLLNAGLTLGEIASFMGWSVRHAAAVIEHYARVSPDESYTVLAKLALAKGGRA